MVALLREEHMTINSQSFLFQLASTISEKPTAEDKSPFTTAMPALTTELLSTQIIYLMIHPDLAQTDFFSIPYVKKIH